MKKITLLSLSILSATVLAGYAPAHAETMDNMSMQDMKGMSAEDMAKMNKAPVKLLPHLNTPMKHHNPITEYSSCKEVMETFKDVAQHKSGLAIFKAPEIKSVYNIIKPYAFKDSKGQPTPSSVSLLMINSIQFCKANPTQSFGAAAENAGMDIQLSAKTK